MVGYDHDDHNKEGMMFPTANSQVYYNEDGEVMGWDAPSEPEYCDQCGFNHAGLCPEDEEEDDEDEDEDERDDTPYLTEDYDFHNEEAAAADEY